DIARNSPNAQLLAPGSRSRAGSEAEPRRASDAPLAHTNAAVTIAAGSGTVTNASRQDVSATRPIRGMPTTHRAGAPASARATTRPRISGVLHTPAAPTPPATRPATPIQSGNCPSARARNEGEAAAGEGADSHKQRARKQDPPQRSSATETRE